MTRLASLVDLAGAPPAIPSAVAALPLRPDERGFVATAFRHGVLPPAVDCQPLVFDRDLLRGHQALVVVPRHGRRVTLPRANDGPCGSGAGGEGSHGTR